MTCLVVNRFIQGLTRSRELCIFQLLSVVLINTVLCISGLDYVFSCFCGIYLTSTVFFCIYIVIMKNRPKIYPKVILPAIASGLMWGVATSCWFVANKSLSIPVAFPIVTTGPSVVASLWGTVVFGEIRVSTTQIKTIKYVQSFCLL